MKHVYTTHQQAEAVIKRANAVRIRRGEPRLALMVYRNGSGYSICGHRTQFKAKVKRPEPYKRNGRRKNDWMVY